MRSSDPKKPPRCYSLAVTDMIGTAFFRVGTLDIEAGEAHHERGAKRRTRSG